MVKPPQHIDLTFLLVWDPSEEPQPSPDAYQVLQRLMKLIWEAHRADVYVEVPDFSVDSEAAPAPTPKERTPRSDRRPLARKVE